MLTATKYLRDDIKSSGKFAIFARLKIEGGWGQRHITEKLPLKSKLLKTLMPESPRMTWKASEIKC